MGIKRNKKGANKNFIQKNSLILLSLECFAANFLAIFNQQWSSHFHVSQIILLRYRLIIICEKIYHNYNARDRVLNT